MTKSGLIRVKLITGEVKWIHHTKLAEYRHLITEVKR